MRRTELPQIAPLVKCWRAPSPQATFNELRSQMSATQTSK
jgi:hypothetical protein